ncbi:MAG: tRNA (adenosine(37)-N6)-dimethylallyltransferase MiaA [Anaerolineales bacterium]|nr:tRNA (adenosine(37)-N6)-dimethylallyltransferase MiaA [Anaerolineales bacterium]
MPSPAESAPAGAEVGASDERPLALLLVGPTAAGKTAVALELAARLPIEIISADSRYLYRGLDIGTAKPSPAEQAAVPHHLIDVTTPDQPWSLAQFQSAALAALAGVQARGRLPVLVGGTGQYVRAVAEGWRLPPGDPAGVTRAALERQLAEAGLPALVARLREVDPASAARVDLRNPRRVIRALEVVITTGASFIAQRGRHPPPYRFVWTGLTLPRPELYARIDARIDAMLAAGLVDEVRRLAAQGYTWDLPAMSAVGYRQIGAYLRGETDLPGAVQAIRRATRQLVRRQANWFKRSDPAIGWFLAETGAAAKLAGFLRQRADADSRLTQT